MTTNCIGGVGSFGERIQNALIQPVGVAPIAWVYHQLGHGDSRAAALGTVFIEGLGLRADAAVQFNVRAAHGGREHAVAIPYVSNTDRFAEMGVLAFHGFFLLRIHFSSI